jgi:hypothetical protein
VKTWSRIASAVSHAMVVGAIWAIQSGMNAGFGGFSRMWHSPDYSFNDTPGPGHLFDVLQAPDGRRIRLLSTDRQTSAQGLAWWSARNGIWLAVDGLAPPRRRAVYQLWLKAPGREPLAIGSVRTDATGSGRLLSLGRSSDGPPHEAVALFITQERAPHAGSPSAAVRLFGLSGQ